MEQEGVDVANRREELAESEETEATVAGDPGLSLGRAVLACRRGGHGDTVSELLAVRDKIWHIGGSHAQRDLFEEMLTDAALRAEETEKARVLLSQRLERRPRSAWGRRHLAEALDRLGDHAGGFGRAQESGRTCPGPLS